MDPFMVLTKWLWILFIVVTFFNAGIYRFRAERHIRENPDLAEGYSILIRGLLIWGNIPWVVMGAGCIFGGVPSVFHFFRPGEGNPFVLAFFGSVFLLWVLGTYWLLFRGGADMLAKHPGMFNVQFKNPLAIKGFWFLCLAGGIAGVAMMFTMDVPLPLDGAGAIKAQEGFIVRRKSIAKRQRNNLKEIRATLMQTRHQPIPETGRWLQRVVQGYFNYHAVSGNMDALESFKREVARSWVHALRRRSQRHRMPWERFTRIAHHWLPKPRILHPYPNVRFFSPNTRGRSRMH